MPDGRPKLVEVVAGHRTKEEKEYRKEDILPIEDAVIINQCGYIFKDSTNQLKYIEHD